jgi:hypothetical protein
VSAKPDTTENEEEKLPPVEKDGRRHESDADVHGLPPFKYSNPPKSVSASLHSNQGYLWNN